ncbi:MAG: CvpA family protein [Bacteroidales bacterium]|nr:CvpA family protein [Bacteroidales bacterium]
MNLLDIIILIPVIWFAFSGFKRGLIIEIATLAALILGVYASIHFSHYAQNFLSNNFDIRDKYLPAASFGLTFVVVLILVFAIGKIFEQVIKFAALGFMNKMAGGFFGILKALVLMSVMFLLISNFRNGLFSSEMKEKSLFFKPVEVIAPFLWRGLKDMSPLIEEKKPEIITAYIDVNNQAR